MSNLNVQKTNLIINIKGFHHFALAWYIFYTVYFKCIFWIRFGTVKRDWCKKWLSTYRGQVVEGKGLRDIVDHRLYRNHLKNYNIFLRPWFRLNDSKIFYDSIGLFLIRTTYKPQKMSKERKKYIFLRWSLLILFVTNKETQYFSSIFFVYRQWIWHNK